MDTVAIIHTVVPVLTTFGDQLNNYLKHPVRVHNMLDDFLASDPAEHGGFSVKNKQRLYNNIHSAQLTGADVIVVTCSTLSPAVQQIRPFVETPIIAVDDAMIRKAVALGSRIFVLATASSTIEPSIERLMGESKKAGKKISMYSRHSEEAYEAMKRGDRDLHDRTVIQMAQEYIKDVDVIVLAQASMAHLEKPLSALFDCPVLSSPGFCMEEIQETLSAKA